jgi:hypothetical protein
MEAIHAENEIEWINSYLQHNGLIDREQVQCITSFSLLWNLFEGHYCNQRASIRAFEAIVMRIAEKGILSLNDFNQHIIYFKSRYVTGEQLNSLFHGLCFRPNDRKELVESILLGKNNDTKDIILSLIIIVYRLRNNLFHGIKSLYEINGQVDNFNNANGILMKVIELARR